MRPVELRQSPGTNAKREEKLHNAPEEERADSAAFETSGGTLHRAWEVGGVSRSLHTLYEDNVLHDRDVRKSTTRLIDIPPDEDSGITVVSSHSPVQWRE